MAEFRWDRTGRARRPDDPSYSDILCDEANLAERYAHSFRAFEMDDVWRQAEPGVTPEWQS